MGRASSAYATVFLIAALWSLGASSPVRAEPGDGIRLDAWTIHPSVEADAEYQTNVFLLADPSLVAHPDDFIFQLIPKITVERLGSRSRIKLYGLYDWREYAFNSGLDALDNFELGGSVAVDEDRPISILASESFRVSSNPNEVESFGLYHQDSNDARLGAIYRPGTALEIRPTIYYDYDRYTENAEMLAERHTVGAILDARWAFLSRTVFAVTGQVNQVHYSDSAALPINPREPINSDSTAWRVDFGVVGQMTPKLNVALLVGDGEAFYSRNASLTSFDDGFAATAKADWTPRQEIALSAGYTRSFQDVWFTNYAVIDDLFAKYKQTFRREIIVQAAATAEWQDYSSPYSRRDFVIRLQPGVRRILANWADVGVGYVLERRWSHIYALGGPPSIDAPSSYITQTFMISANLKW